MWFKQRSTKPVIPWFLTIVSLFILCGQSTPGLAAPYRVGVLMVGDIRMETFNGLKAGLQVSGFTEGKDIVFETKDAGGSRPALLDLAREITAARPDVAIACGGVEADALKVATSGTSVPVVFLAVASAVDRGLVDSMARPGGNLTGVDTNDSQLTAKRLWFIKWMFPDVSRIIIPHVTSVPPSVTSVAIARETAPGLNIDIVVIEAADKAEIMAKAAGLSKTTGDAICMVPSAPLWQIEKEVLFPISVSEKIPIMGVNRGDLQRGAVAAYAGNRFEAGKQAARLVKKIFDGEEPANIPVETPERIEFLINKWTVDRLGLALSKRVWRMANEVVDIEVAP